jgi:hypothetical protein
VILIFLSGGPAQLDTFDPKPDAPEEVRGPFGSIPTAVPGVRVTELFPRIARLMDRVASCDPCTTRPAATTTATTG